MVGFGNVDNTSDLANQHRNTISFRFKSSFEFANFYRNCFWNRQSHGGLGSVDNTRCTKPVSAAAQTALDLKAI
jgi:hypothetical protein